MLKENVVFIYGLFDPRYSEEVRYVGKAVNIPRRIKKHIATAYRTDYPVNRWVRKLLEEGFTPQYKVLAVTDECNWQAEEIRLIAQYKNAKLLNCTDGGEGVIDSTGEVADKISKSNTGKIRTLEQRAKNGLAKRGQIVSEITRRKISAALTGRKMPPEAVEKSRQAKIGKKASPELRAKLSAAHKGKPLSAAQVRANSNRIIKNSGYLYCYVSPDGLELEFTNMAQFCRERNLSAGIMHDLAYGRGKIHRGFIFKSKTVCHRS